MKTKVLDYIDFEKVNTLLEGFNKSTGFITSILDLKGNVLSKSGWRQMCTEFHRINPETSKKCTISDTVLAGKLAKGEKFHYYKCLNGLVDVAVPIVINGEHIANLFSGQFFFEEPDILFFKKQAKKYGFDEEKYIAALKNVPVISKEKAKTAMDFLLSMTQLISELTFQKLEQMELNIAIKESEEKFKSVFESANVGKSITLPTGEINVNETFCKMLGYTRKELQNKRWQELTPEDEIPTILKILEPLLKGEKDSARFEKRYICKNGKYIWADVSVSINHDDKGKPLHFITTIIDITERKRMEEELRISEELFSNAFHIGPAGMTITRIADGKFIDANESFCKMFEFDRDEVIGHTSTGLNLWTLEERKRLIQQRLSSGGLHNFELVAHSKSGRLIYLLFSSKQLELRGETCLITTMIDITGRKRTEEALRESGDFIKAVMDNLPIGVAVNSVDPSVNFNYMNENFPAIYRTTREALAVPDNFWNAVYEDPAFREEMKKRILEDLASGEAERMHWEDVPITRRGEKTTYINACNAQVPGKPLMISTVWDITERKQIEEKVRENSSLIRIASEKAKLGGWNVDLKENRSYWSDEVAAIHEMPPGYAPLVEDGINFYAPEWRDRIIKVFTDCAGNGVSYDEEMEIITSTGKRVWVRTIGEAVRDENGNIYKVEGAFQDISEKKIAEAKVREKDLQFRKLSSNVPDLIFQFTRRPDGSYCVPVASEGIMNIFGCTPEDVVDDFTPIGKVIFPEDAERVIADIEYSASHLNQFTCEFRVLIPGRPVQWILSRSTPEKLPDGSVTWYGFNANITHRKEVEEQLRESEKRFKLLFDHATFGIVICQLIRDKDGKAIDYLYMQVNESTLRHVGIKPLDILGKFASEVLSGEDTILLVEKIKTVVETGIPVEYQQYFSTFNRTIDIQIINIVGDYFSVVFFDVSEKKESEEKINKLNDRLQILVEAIKDLSIASNLETIMKTVRTSARRLVNADGSTFVLLDGDSCYYADEDTISPLWKGQRFPLNTCISGWAMLNKQSVKIEDIYSDPRIPIEAYKSTFVKSLAVVPIRISDPLGAIGAYWKINYVPSETELQLLQTLADATARAVENIRLLEGLEKMVETRTSLLEAANKELEAFSYSVSHDLRAPLRHINGFSEILTKNYSAQLPEEARKYLNTITGSTQKMGTLIDDLLSFSRTGRAELKKSTLKMNQVIEDALAQIKPSLMDRKINWKISPLPEVYGDYNLLRQVWINLLDNAVKYTRTREDAIINIGFKDEKKEIVFYIQDNGVGFDMKYADKLFGVFQRLHSSSQFDGTGIGLANVQRIILRHGGRTWAEAETDKGAIFYFSIPKEMEDKL